MKHGEKKMWDMKPDGSPPVDYLVQILSTLNPKHRFFEKKFSPDKNAIPNVDQKLAAMKQDAVMSHGIFKNLPLDLLLSRKKLEKIHGGFSNVSDESNNYRSLIFKINNQITLTNPFLYRNKAC